VLINSCTVVNPSQTAFINMVCRAKKIKKPIVVAGCVPQGEQGIPELDNVSAVGVTQIDRIVEVVDETLKGHKVQLMTKKGLPSLDLPKIRKNKDIEM
jgi:threonylcarbamoyladenosine tRNA methylthiotransferase CDKAL1